MKKDKLKHLTYAFISNGLLVIAFHIFTVTPYKWYLASLTALIFWFIKDNVWDKWRGNHDPYDFAYDFTGIFIFNVLYWIGVWAWVISIVRRFL